MMIETAQVVSYQQGVAVVQCFAKNSCGGCAAKPACGTRALSALSGEKIAPRFELKVDVPLKVGDFVQIGLSEQTLLQSVLWIYALPLLVLMITAVIFSHFFTNELLIALAMCCCTGLTFWAVQQKFKRQKSTDFIPIFLGRV